MIAQEILCCSTERSTAARRRTNCGRPSAAGYSSGANFGAEVRFVEQIADVPAPAESGTSSSAAVPLDTAEWLGDRGFRTFSPGQKSATSAPQSSANMLSHSSSWTPAPYQVDELREEYLSRHLGPDWRERARRGEFG